MIQDLSGEKIVITAGATREEIDPVRFISNHSSGKMGFALAEAAAGRGAIVTLITGATTIEPPAGIKRIRRAFSAEEMMLAASEEVTVATTVFIAAAAVADYRPVRRAENKIKRGAGNLVIEFEPTSDILAEISKNRHANLTVVGFAAETTDLIEHARRKLARKNLDLIVANDVSQSDAGFGSDDNRVVILSHDGALVQLPLLPKTEVANRILDALLDFRQARF